MTMTQPVRSDPREPALDRSLAMRLAAVEYRRGADLLASLQPGDWDAATDCPGWDVRAVAGHLLGMVDFARSLREQRRQTKRAAARGGVFIDALTALQVEERAGLTTAQLSERYARRSPKAARARRRTPGLIRRRTMPVPQHVNDQDETWTIGYLVDVILTRDPWMHRIDIVRAAGARHILTPDHDGVLVADVVAEWAQRHGQPYSLQLTGPAGGEWSVDGAGPTIEMDAIEFCRVLSGRGTSSGLLATEVPF